MHHSDGTAVAPRFGTLSRDPVTMLTAAQFATLLSGGRTPVYLVRHGQTDWNSQLRLQGREDVPLNQRGIRQSIECGEIFRAAAEEGFHVRQVYSSPLIRCTRTAEYIAAAMDMAPPIAYSMLTERDYGELSGLTMTERRERYPGGERHARGIESKRRAGMRLRYAVSAIAARSSEGAVAVTHGGVLGALFHVITSGRVGSGKNLSDNCGISIVAAGHHDVIPVAFNLGREEFLPYALSAASILSEKK